MKKTLDHGMAIALAIGLTVVLTLSVGCASHVRAKAMTPTGFHLTSTYPYSVIVRVEGGSEAASSLDIAQVSADEFREALLSALRETQLFSSIRDSPPADYRLTVGFVQSEWKGTFKIKGALATRWQLTRLVDGQTFCNEILETSADATMGDGFAGNARVRAAKEKGLFSRICGSAVVRVIVQGCDKERFPSRDRCGIHRIFW